MKFVQFDSLSLSVSMSKPVVLFSCPYMTRDKERFVPVLEALGLEVLLPRHLEERMSEEELLDLAGTFDGALCADDRYSAAVLEACAPRLKVISKWGTGLDSIDLQKAKELGVFVGNTPNAFTIPVADNTLGWMLCFSRRLVEADAMVKSGSWAKLPCKSLSEQTLGVVGGGLIGRAVIRRARAFGMRCLVFDVATLPRDFLLEEAVMQVSFDELLRSSDFVSLNCDLNPNTRHLMNMEAFLKMKPSAVVINCARGPVVDEAALIEALDKKIIAGAALDVFEVEPVPKHSPLLKMSNVMLSPHNGSSSPAAWEHVHYNSLRNLLQGLHVPFDDQELRKKLHL